MHMWKIEVCATKLRHLAWLLHSSRVVGIFHVPTASLRTPLGFWVVRFHVPPWFGTEGSALQFKMPNFFKAITKQQSIYSIFLNLRRVDSPSEQVNYP